MRKIMMLATSFALLALPTLAGQMKAETSNPAVSSQSAAQPGFQNPGQSAPQGNENLAAVPGETSPNGGQMTTRPQYYAQAFAPNARPDAPNGPRLNAGLGG